MGKTFEETEMAEKALIPLDTALGMLEEGIAKREKVSPLLAVAYQVFLFQLQDHIILEEAKVRGLV